MREVRSSVLGNWVNEKTERLYSSASERTQRAPSSCSCLLYPFNPSQKLSTPSSMTRLFESFKEMNKLSRNDISMRIFELSITNNIN